jgi:DNA-binding PadR family transcriptional regulator
MPRQTPRTNPPKGTPDEITSTEEGVDAAPDLPSTNAMAVLGLLAIAPMTAYAIAEQTRRALGNVWPASRRLLLGEPRRLAAKGLVESIPAPRGSRAGQRWQATPSGRTTMTRWLQSPVGGTEINSEIALRLIFADHGDVETLQRQVRLRLEQLEEEMRTALAILDDYLDTGGPFPHRLHITTATSRFIAEIKIGEHQFLTWLLDELTRWPDTTTPDPDRHHDVLRRIRDRVLPLLDTPN